MCLVTKQPAPFYALQDIKVYKILNRQSNSTQKKYKPNTNYDETAAFLKDINIGNSGSFKYIFSGSIHKAFHSYTLEAVKLHRIDEQPADWRKVVEFVIPKGALYFTGYHNSDIPSEQGFASSQIRVGNLVDFFATPTPATVTKVVKKKVQARDAYGRFA